jgi:hypothetical protein
MVLVTTGKRGGNSGFFISVGQQLAALSDTKLMNGPFIHHPLMPICSFRLELKMQTCPICGKKARIWHPGDYRLCSCPGDCGDSEISEAAEAAMKLSKYDGTRIGQPYADGINPVNLSRRSQKRISPHCMPRVTRRQSRERSRLFPLSPPQTSLH